MNAFSPPMSQLIARTVMIHCHDQGTGFFVDIEGFQYLITAAHILSSVSAAKLRLRLAVDYIDFACDILALDEKLDIAVLRPPQYVGHKDSTILLTTKGLMYGQHVFFLGFPYGECRVFNAYGGGRLPFPFVKWAAVSNLGHGKSPHILDGINNPGFSGGPVCFNVGPKRQDICGMIVGFKEELRPAEENQAAIERSYLYRQNTGLIYAVTAEAIYDLVKVARKGLPIPG